MKTIEFCWMHRYDYEALCECEHCGNKQYMRGYNDANFHNNVVPKVRCHKCNKDRNGEESTQYEPYGGTSLFKNPYSDKQHELYKNRYPM